MNLGPDLADSDLSRAHAACSARAILGEDFFGGWEQSDIELFLRHGRSESPAPGKITDFFGIRTNSSFHPWATHFDGVVIRSVPLPDDSLRAEAIEYFATLDSLEAAPVDSFKVAELGASYGPWICFCAVMAERTGRGRGRFVAVEASDYLYNLIPHHLAENGIEPTAGDFTFVKGAIAAERGTLYFPRVSNPMENGGQAKGDDGEVDYLGRQVEHDCVEAYPLAEVLGADIWDLVHIDIQGAEYDVLSAGIDILDTHVRAIFVGTHSRKIEGQLLELFDGRGWVLRRERPTRFNYCPDRRSIVSWATRDGGQYWINPKLRG
ncbi:MULTISPECIES: FkbM family methyltransferase [Sphingobium]|uniref:FkbM family methyltransferase n=1 Tax=Sphingobium TaxID=165695 RepID=UPI0015EC6B4B|nr:MULTISPECIES: FkbM family methyltransferase [Sphingobium]MCW2361388.1 FkbM family methyltransferase [Sphingobium sp. B10D3B]MCW2401933.1 FkbM family methyltransferase [Sphingobium sp. B10D7B]MCW2408912.1 FkbM family methyltransferase [Sphingobium xanthum]